MSTTIDRIERETTIAAPPERVWDVLTQAEHLGTWFGDVGATIDLRPGGALSLTWEKHGTANGQVETVEPPRKFVFRWLLEQGVTDEPTPANSTRVEFNLTPEGDGTRLKVTESGFATLALSPEERERQRTGNIKGWQIEIGHLKEHAERVAAGV
jgi:uncharacterized protein YndB with AHSA1/START domain